MALQRTDESVVHGVSQESFDTINAIIAGVKEQLGITYDKAAKHGYACVYYPRSIVLYCQGDTISVTRNTCGRNVYGIAGAIAEIKRLYNSDDFMPKYVSTFSELDGMEEVLE